MKRTLNRLLAIALALLMLVSGFALSEGEFAEEEISLIEEEEAVIETEAVEEPEAVEETEAVEVEEIEEIETEAIPEAEEALIIEEAPAEELPAEDLPVEEAAEDEAAEEEVVEGQAEEEMPELMLAAKHEHELDEYDSKAFFDGTVNSWNEYQCVFTGKITICQWCDTCGDHITVSTQSVSKKTMPMYYCSCDYLDYDSSSMYPDCFSYDLASGTLYYTGDYEIYGEVIVNDTTNGILLLESGTFRNEPYYDFLEVVVEDTPDDYDDECHYYTGEVDIACYDYDYDEEDYFVAARLTVDAGDDYIGAWHNLVYASDTGAARCTECAYELYCDHEWRMVSYGYGAEYDCVDIDSKQHYVWGVEEYVPVCRYCGVEDWDNSTIGECARFENHQMINGVCVVCQRGNKCSHTFEDDFTISIPSSARAIQGDPLRHTVTGKLYDTKWCDRCGYIAVKSSRAYSDIDTHRWGPDGKCIDCGARSCGSHSESDFEDVIVYYDGTFSIDPEMPEEYHRFTGDIYLMRACPYCGYYDYFDDGIWDEYVTDLQLPHALLDGKCIDCGYTQTAPQSISIHHWAIEDGAMTVELNEEFDLGYTMEPFYAGSKLTWTSSAPKVVSIVQTAEGVVCKALTEGTSTITVKTANGKKATCKVTVVDLMRLTGLSVYCLNENQYASGSITVFLENGAYRFRADPVPVYTEAQYTWKSSNEKVALLFPDEEYTVLQPVSEGTATITCTAQRGSVKKTASFTVQVVDPFKLTGITAYYPEWMQLDGSDMEYDDDEYQYRQIYTYFTPYSATADVTYKSSSTKIVTVDQYGYVTPHAVGTATITVTAVRGKVKKSTSFKVYVEDSRRMTAFTMDKKLTIGDSEDDFIMWNIEPYEAKDFTTLTWKSSNKGIVEVDDEGYLYPVKAGTATITCTAQSDVDPKLKKTATCKVTVTDPDKLTAIHCDAGTAWNAFVGETLDGSCWVEPWTAEVIYSWKSSNNDVAWVEWDEETGEYTVYAEKAGSATLTVTAASVNNPKLKKSTTIKVKVTDPNKPDKVWLTYNSAELYMYYDDSFDIEGWVNCWDECDYFEIPYDNSGATYEWKSSNTKVVDFESRDDQHAILIPVGAGSATVTYTVQNAGVKKSATLKVKVVDPFKDGKLTLSRTGTTQLCVGEDLRITDIITPYDGEIDDCVVYWTSSSESIAQITYYDEDMPGNCYLTANAPGTATITCTVTAHGIKKTATCKVKVVKSDSNKQLK